MTSSIALYGFILIERYSSHKGHPVSTKEHKARAPKSLSIAVITVSTTRSLKDDKSGHWIRKRAEKKRHKVVFHDVIGDDRAVIQEKVREVMQLYGPNVILINGGTGVSPDDVTIEAVRPLFTKELTAFGPLFAQLSFEDIGSSALLSRATAGVVDRTVVFCIPGSLKACKLACLELILPELGHLAKHVLDSH
jgi:molybdenum cofactor biosynthesis protein B